MPERLLEWNYSNIPVLGGTLAGQGKSANFRKMLSGNQLILNALRLRLMRMANAQEADSTAMIRNDSSCNFLRSHRELFSWTMLALNVPSEVRAFFDHYDAITSGLGEFILAWSNAEF